MYAFGAEVSEQIFHTWFRDGDPDYDDAQKSRLGPPPGYVPAGPINSTALSAAEPLHQNHACAAATAEGVHGLQTGWEPTIEHDQSWEITETGIYYQAAYVMLVSKFVE